MPKDLRSLSMEELRAYYDTEPKKDEGRSVKKILSSTGDFFDSLWAAGVNRAGTTYDWAFNNNPDGVGYNFDYNTALQLQDQKRQLEQIDTSTLSTSQLQDYINQKNAITSNFKALLTDQHAYDEKQMDSFLDKYRESYGYELLQEVAKEEQAKKPKREQVLEKLAMEEMRANVFKNLEFKDHTLTNSEGKTISYSAHDLPIIMDTVIKNHQRNFDSAIKALAFYQNLEETNQTLSEDDKKTKKEAEDHIKNLSRYMADYINNLEFSTSVGSANFANQWMVSTDSDNPFTVQNGIGWQSNPELYFERQLNQRRIGKNPFNLLEYVEAASNLLYEVGDTAMTGLKFLAKTPFKGINQTVIEANILHDSEQVTNTEKQLLKEDTFVSTMSSWLLDAGPDIAIFYVQNALTGGAAGVAEKALQIEKISKGFNIAAKIIKGSKKIQLDKIDEAILASEAATTTTKALSSITSFIVRETIENVGAQMAISGGTMEDYNEVDLALDIGFSVLFGGFATGVKVKNSKALLEQDKALLRAEAGKRIYGISDELRSQIDDQTKFTIGDSTLTFIKNEKLTPHLEALSKKAKATYENIEDFVGQVKTVAESRWQEVLKFASTTKKYGHLINASQDGVFSLSKQAPEGIYLDLNHEYIKTKLIEQEGEKSKFAAAHSVFLLNKELSFIERIKKSREAWKNFDQKQQLDQLEKRKRVVEKDPIMHALFEKWIFDTKRERPQNNDQRVERLDEFSYESKRIIDEYNAKGEELRSGIINTAKTPTDFSAKTQLPKNKAVPMSWVQEFIKTYNELKNIDKTQILRAIQQGYDFAEKFIPSLAVNGREYFNAVMDSPINMAAKFAALNPVKFASSRKLNRVSTTFDNGILKIKDAMFDNPVEIAYFLGKNGEVEINKVKYQYEVDLPTGTLTIHGPNTEPIDLLKSGQTLPASQASDLIFHKAEPLPAEETLKVNNTVTSVFASRYSYNKAKTLNAGFEKISESKYNRIAKLNLSPLQKAKVFEELIESPPKFSEAVFKKTNGNLYMGDGDYGFRYQETMNMYRGKGGEVSTRDMSSTKNYGKEKTYRYSYDTKTSQYILSDIETGKAVGRANKDEVFLNDAIFKGDIQISPTNQKLNTFDSGIKLLKSIFDNDLTNEELVKQYMEFTGKEMPRTNSEISDAILEAYYTKYGDGLPRGLEIEDIKELNKIDPDDLSSIFDTSKRYHLELDAFRQLINDILNKHKKILDFAVNNTPNLGSIEEKFYHYLGYYYPKLVKVEYGDAKKLIHTTQTLFSDVIPESFFKEGGPLDSPIILNDLNKIIEEKGLQSDEVHQFLQNILKGSKQKYEEALDVLRAEYAIFQEEIKALPDYKIHVDPATGETFLIKEIKQEYESLISDMEKFRDNIYKEEIPLQTPQEPNLADQLAESIPDNKATSLSDEIIAAEQKKAKPPKKDKPPQTPEEPKPEPQPDLIVKDVDYEDEVFDGFVPTKGIDYHQKYGEYIEYRRNKLAKDEHEIEDVFDIDYTAESVRGTDKSASYYLNKEVYSPNKHVSFLDEDVFVSLPEVDSKTYTISDLRDSISKFVKTNNPKVVGKSSYNTLIKIYHKLKDNPISEIEKLNDSHTYRNQKRSIIDFMRISVEMLLRGADPMEYKLLLPRLDKPTYNNYLNFYMSTWGPLNKDVFDISRKGSLFGTYYYQNLSSYIDSQFSVGSKIRQNVFDKIFVYRHGTEKNLDKFNNIVEALYVIADLYDTLPFKHKDRNSLKVINQGLFNTNANVIRNWLDNGQLKTAFNTLTYGTPFFNVTDELTSYRMHRLTGNSSVLGVIKNNLHQADTFSAKATIADFPKDKHFVFVRDIENYNAFIKTMDEMGYELLVMKGFDAQILSPFGLLFREKTQIVNPDVLEKIEDIARSKQEINIDHNVGTKELPIPMNAEQVKVSDDYEEKKIIKFPSDPQLWRNAVSKDTAKAVMNPFEGVKELTPAQTYNRQYRKHLREKAFRRIINPNGAINKKEFLSYINSYGSPRIKELADGSLFIEKKTKAIPWVSEATQAMQKKMLYESGVPVEKIGDFFVGKIKLRIGVPDNVPGNGMKVSGITTEVFDRNLRTPLKRTDLSKENAERIVERFSKNTEILRSNNEMKSFGDILFNQIKLIKERGYTKDVQVGDVFLPSTDLSAVDKAFEEFYKINKDLNYVIDPDGVTDEFFNANKNYFEVPGSVVLVQRPSDLKGFIKTYNTMLEMGYEHVYEDNILGEFLNLNGTYFRKTKESDKQIIENQKSKAKNIADSQSNNLTHCG